MLRGCFQLVPWRRMSAKELKASGWWEGREEVEVRRRGGRNVIVEELRIDDEGAHEDATRTRFAARM